MLASVETQSHPVTDNNTISLCERCKSYG